MNEQTNNQKEAVGLFNGWLDPTAEDNLYRLLCELLALA